jgi:hypothetical protein
MFIAAFCVRKNGTSHIILNDNESQKLCSLWARMSSFKTQGKELLFEYENVGMKRRAVPFEYVAF